MIPLYIVFECITTHTSQICLDFSLIFGILYIHVLISIVNIVIIIIMSIIIILTTWIFIAIGEKNPKYFGKYVPLIDFLMAERSRSHQGVNAFHNTILL